MPGTAVFQPRIGPNLAHLCARLGLVFAESILATIENGDTFSEKTHFGLIEPAIMRGRRERRCGMFRARGTRPDSESALFVVGLCQCEVLSTEI
jgi:hypothetical protein